MPASDAWCTRYTLQMSEAKTGHMRHNLNYRCVRPMTGGEQQPGVEEFLP